MESILSSKFRHSKRKYYLVRIPSGISNRLQSVCFSYKKKPKHKYEERQYKTREQALKASQAFFKKHYNFIPLDPYIKE